MVKYGCEFLGWSERQQMLEDIIYKIRNVDDEIVVETELTKDELDYIHNQLYLRYGMSVSFI